MQRRLAKPRIVIINDFTVYYFHHPRLHLFSKNMMERQTNPSRFRPTRDTSSPAKEGSEGRIEDVGNDDLVDSFGDKLRLDNRAESVSTRSCASPD